MVKLKVTLIPGDGIGPEVVNAAVQCVDALLDVDWHYTEIGDQAIKDFGKELPVKALQLAKKTKITLKGPVTTPIGGGFHSVNVKLRKELGLYANVRPCKTLQGIDTPYKVDLVVIRENTEDSYSGIEFKQGKFARILRQYHMPTNSAVALKTISSKASKRIVDYAFKYAKQNKRKKVTAVHKANILKITDGLFAKSAREVAKKYTIKFEEKLVDNMAMQLVKKPEEYDVLVTTNLYGDILSDLCAGLVGGLGLVAGANIGDKYAVFETVHGSAPKYAGKNKVNPAAAIFAAVMMLNHIGKEKEARKIEDAVKQVIKEGRHITYDIAKSKSKAVGTKEMTAAILKRIRK